MECALTVRQGGEGDVVVSHSEPFGVTFVGGSQGLDAVPGCKADLHEQHHLNQSGGAYAQGKPFKDVVQNQPDLGRTVVAPGLGELLQLEGGDQLHGVVVPLPVDSLLAVSGVLKDSV